MKLFERKVKKDQEVWVCTFVLLFEGHFYAMIGVGTLLQKGKL